MLGFPFPYIFFFTNEKSCVIYVLAFPYLIISLFTFYTPVLPCTLILIPIFNLQVVPSRHPSFTSMCVNLVVDLLCPPASGYHSRPKCIHHQPSTMFAETLWTNTGGGFDLTPRRKAKSVIGDFTPLVIWGYRERPEEMPVYVGVPDIRKTGIHEKEASCSYPGSKDKYSIPWTHCCW